MAEQIKSGKARPASGPSGGVRYFLGLLRQGGFLFELFFIPLLSGNKSGEKCLCFQSALPFRKSGSLHAAEQACPAMARTVLSSATLQGCTGLAS